MSKINHPLFLAAALHLESVKRLVVLCRKRLCAKASEAKGESTSNAHEFLPEADSGYLSTQPLSSTLYISFKEVLGFSRWRKLARASQSFSERSFSTSLCCTDARKLYAFTHEATQSPPKGVAWPPEGF